MVMAVSPPDGETAVGVNPHYAVRYDEPVTNMVFGGAGVFNLQYSEGNRVIRYLRTGTLASETEVTETMPEARDLSGNEVASTSTTFTTRNGPDLGAGSIVSISVASGATNVPLNPILVAETSEPIDPVSLTDTGVYLYDNVTGLRPPVTRSLSADGRRVTIVPVDPLPLGRSHRWYVYYLRDLSGNGMGNPSWTFTTGSEVDIDGPVKESSTVFDEQTGIPTNVRLSVRFDEPLNPQLLSGVQLSDGVGNLPVIVSLNGDRRTVTLVPRELLAPLSDFTLTVAGVEDVSGNALVTPVVLDFTTAESIDNVRGNIVRYSYASDATVPRNAVFEVLLDERVDPTTVNGSVFYLWNESTNSGIPGTRSIAADGRTLTFTPDVLLPADSQLRLYTSYSYFYDFAGNLINRQSRRFYTNAIEDETPPTVIVASVADGEVGPPTNLRMRIKFSEPINPIDLSGMVIRDAGDNPIDTAVGFNGSVNIVTLTPTSPLAPDSSYSLLISGVEDVAGIPMESDQIVSFVTGPTADTTRGSVSRWSYSTDATVPLNGVIEVLVNERVDPTTVNGSVFWLYNESTGTNVPGSIDVSTDGRTLKFTPTGGLLPVNSQLRLYVSWTYIYDQAGNLVNNTNRRFYTGTVEDSTDPEIVVTTATDSVPTNTRLNVLFNEPINPVVAAGLTLLDADDNVVPTSFTFNSNFKLVTLTPLAPLAADSNYTLSLQGLEDVAGNPLADELILFDTGAGEDTVRGSVSHWSVATDVTVPRNAVLQVGLNERVDPTTVNGSVFYVWNETTNSVVPGTGSVSADRRTVSYIPDELLPANSQLRFWVSWAYFYDFAGNRFNNVYRRFYTNAAEDNTAPEVVVTTAADGETDLPLNMRMNVRFDEAVNPVDLSGLVLSDAGSNPVPVSTSYNTNVRLLTLTPQAALDASSSYTLDVSAVQDVAGNALSTPLEVNFDTGAVTDTTIGSISGWSFAADATLDRDAVLNVTLNEKVDPTTVTGAVFYLWNESTNSNVPGVGVVSADGLMVTFVPDALLPANSQLKLWVSWAYFYDKAGNRFNNVNRRFFTNAVP
jgi:hypothetical protein